jgi:hypothetical protein
LECSQQNDKIVLFRKDFFKELKEKIEEEPEGDVEFLLDSFLIYNS